MAQDERGLPVPGDKNKRRRASADLLPRYFRTVANKKFLSSTLDQLTQPGLVEKVEGYVGRKDSKSYKSTDNYLSDVSPDRENYQLEPATVIKDTLDNVTFYKDYRDYVNSTKIRNADISDHSIISSQEYYSWNPHVNWDKLVNFREYYWLPSGPDSIPVYGTAIDIKSTINISKVDGADNNAYNFSKENILSNPTITLYKGHTYTFDINAIDMPFSIRTSVDISDDTNLYNTGVSQQKVENGKITFKIDNEAPDILYYVDSNSIEGSGIFNIKNVRDASYLQVTDEIIGKKNYTMSNGYELANGMKLKFYGIIEPSQYAQDDWYVEGVGDSIKLVNEKDLTIPASFLLDRTIEFDNNAFDKLPFDDATSYAQSKDYIVINKSSKDRNQWSRYNNWTHRNVLETTATINETTPEINQIYRATRPIIEYDAGIKLYNFGTEAKTDVDLVDTVTTDVFSNIEGQEGYFVDGIQLVSGMRVLFTADPDSFVAGKIYTVTFLKHNSKTIISLKETVDTTPQTNETVLVKSGTKYKGKIFYYTGTTWTQSQDKTALNQAPLFDLYNDGGSALNTLDASTFTGTKLFSYKVGTGTNDTELGFPLSYRTLENSGDIVFDFNLLSDTFTYEVLTDVLTISTDTALVRKYTNRTTFTPQTGWIKAHQNSVQPVVRQYDTTEQTNNFAIDVYDKSGTLTDITKKVYVNDILKRPTTDYTITYTNNIAYITFVTAITAGQKLVIKTTSNTKKNANGHYEFPINFEKNPQNENVLTFTLGEAVDHVNSIVDNLDDFLGAYPGAGNLNNLGPVSQYGERFVQHSGPVNLALYHLADKTNSATDAIRFAGDEYSKFKKEFLKVANELGFDGATKIHVDKVINELNSSRTSQDPFYFSDMIPYKGDTTLNYEITSPNSTSFALTRPITLTELTENAVLVYLDDEQLMFDKDYTLSTDGFITITKTVTTGQKLTIYEYESTDGCWIPPTPTKLGLYPKFQPSIYIDDTYISEAVGENYGPYKIYGRDETTTKSYKSKLGWFYPVFTDEVAAQNEDKRNGGIGKTHTHVIEGLNMTLYMPNGSMGHATNDSEEYNEFPIGKAVIQGHDGSIWRCFGDYRDKLLLDLETRIYNNIKITYDTNILDVDNFIDRKYSTTRYTRDKRNLTQIVDFTRWLDILGSPDYTTNTRYKRTNGFTFNYRYMSDPNGIPLPGYWREIYKELYATDRPHTHPWEMLGIYIKPTWWNTQYGPAPYTSNNTIMWEDIGKGIVREPNKKVVYKKKYTNPLLLQHIPTDTQGNLLSPIDTGYAQGTIDSYLSTNFVFGDGSPTETAWRRSSSYPFALMTSWALIQPAQFFGLAFDRSRIKRNTANELVYTETNKRIALDKLVFPNIATGTSRVFTSGIVNYMQGYLGQNSNSAYTKYQTDLKLVNNQLAVKIGGFTQKNKFKLILDARTPTNEGNVFVPEENYNVVLNTSIPLEVYSYSGVIVERAPLGFYIRGYDKESPVFKILKPIKTSRDPVVTVGGLSEKFITWTQGEFYSEGQVVENNDNYFRVKVSHSASDQFNLDYFAKLPGVPQVGGATASISKTYESNITNVPYGTLYTTVQEVVDFIVSYGEYLKSVGFIFERFNQDLVEIENWNLSAREFMFWTVQAWDTGTLLTLSPSATSLKFQKDFTVVDDIFNNFYDYSLLQADGKRLLADFTTTERDNTTEFGISVKNTAEGIYHLKVPVVQKEHVIVIDNKTLFGDVVYNRAQGYRQKRIKINGYRSDDWNGSLNVPGFIYDDAKVTEWTPWQSYVIGDLVQNKQFYYAAKNNLSGSELFIDSQWIRLNERPVNQLKPNFDYKAKQFADFYDLDSDNFDTEQQRLAQHLIGYQKRQYLENIIIDGVAQYKFFQGAIQDKGTKNVLSKLFDKLGSSNKESLEFYEEWAIRIGRYGATEGIDEFEVKLDEEKYRLDPQTVELVNEIDPKDTTLVYKLDRNGVYLKSQNYNHKPFPTKYITDATSYLPTAGYVNPADVTLSLTTYNNITNQSIDTLTEGQYVWTASDKTQLTWAVYRYFTTDLNITEIKEAAGGFILVVDSYPAELAIGDVIGVNDTDTTVNGFWKITNILLNEITVENTVEDTAAIAAPLAGYVTAFKNVRSATLPAANDIIKHKGTKDFSFASDTSSDSGTIWVDDDDTGQWTVLRNSQKFKFQPLIYNKGAGVVDSTQKDFGETLSITYDNNTLIATAPKDLNGSVYVFKRPSEGTEFSLIQQVDEYPGLYDTNGGFGKSASVSADGEYLVVGSPNASNVKSKYKGDYTNAITYSIGDISSYGAQLWRARQIVEADSVQEFKSFSSNAQTIENSYNASTLAYPTQPYILRGNYSFPEVATDHILIRAEKEQWEGSKAGDTLNLRWNRYNTANPTGLLPFNGDNVLTETLLNGDHTIIDKVELIVKVGSTQFVPDVGTEVLTSTARAIVQYRYVSADNQMIVYLKDINGLITNGDTLSIGTVTIGDYEFVYNITDDQHAGWWYVNVGSTFTTSNIQELNPNLIVNNITVSPSSVNNSTFTNIFDTKVLEVSGQPSKASYIQVLSHTSGVDETAIVESKWVIRTPKAHGDALLVGDKIRTWVNTLKLNNIVQDPNAIGLPWTYLNTTEHTITDKWDGWAEVLFTNFTLAGDPYVPTVGTVVTDTATGSFATVAYVQRGFSTVRLYLKNRSGVWSKGLAFSESSTLTFVENDSTVRLVGTIQNTHLDNSLVGPLLVIDKSSNIPVPATNFLEDLEYWIYNTFTRQGIQLALNPPTPLNLDWQQVYNIPLAEAGTSREITEEGTFAVYQRKGINFQLLSYYTIPDAAQYLHLGTKVEIRSPSTNSYIAYIHAKGDGTELNQGKLYIVRKNSTQDWEYGKDTAYRGEFSELITYFENDIVKYGNAIFKSTTNQIAGAFNSTYWTEQTDGVDVTGYLPNDSGFYFGDSVVEQQGMVNFAENFDVSKDGSVLVTVAEYTNHEDSSLPARKVVIYRYVNGAYKWDQVIEPFDSTEDFAKDIAISSDGTKLSIGAPLNSGSVTNGGAVYVYLQKDGSFVWSQTLRPVDQTINTQFGNAVDFDGFTLAITSRGGDMEKLTSFDSASTIFDNGSTGFRTFDVDSGKVSVYETINNSILYAQDFSYSVDTQKFGDHIKVNGNHVYVGLPKQGVPQSVEVGQIVEYRKPLNTMTWSKLRTPVSSADVSKFKGVYLYNTKDNSLVTYLDYIDPIQGKIAGPAEQEISFKTSYDPAKYSNSTDTTITADTLDFTSTEWVGKIWWDIDSAKFINHYQGSIIESSNTFNTIFTGTDVAVYEWIESPLLPSEWDATADSESGLTQGISGASKYGDTVYSTRRVYDSSSGTFTTYYYYWVTNKKTVPQNNDTRKISAYDVYQYIKNPSQQGHKFVSILANNRFAIYNCESLIQDKDVAINFTWWTIENQLQSTHDEYQIVSDGLGTSRPNIEVQQKWFDSLVGFDTNNRPVPDINLPPKRKYGNLNEPRQSWFVNKTEAKKQFFERVNGVLKQELVVDDFDLTDLSAFDPLPTLGSGKYDAVSDTYAEIGFVSTARVKQAILSLTIENGSISAVSIVNGGEGYINAPTYKITDVEGSGCEIRFTLNTSGTITDVKILNAGSNYTANTTISVRRFQALVKADENIGGKWSVFDWNGTAWNRVLTQSYDTRAYWKYVDWYLADYNQFTDINQTVESSYELSGLQNNIGDIVKINNVGTGGWLLLEKTNSINTEDYTQNYKTVGRQNATIEFKNSLYDVTNENVAFDGASYDRIFFDTEPIKEARIILDTLKDKIFVDNLAIEWNKLFFASIRYVFFEQPSVDWIFKTSFVKVKHNVGELAQKVTFQNDSLPSYQKFVEEFKPYKTQIREYISSYEKIDPANSSISDFDLAPYYDEEQGKIVPQSVQVIDNKVVTSQTEIQSYPSKHWLDNIGFELSSVNIADAGSGYNVVPTLEITGGGGTGAVAEAYVGNGKITSVKVTKGGKGYLSQPTITVNGSIDEGGATARLSPVLGGGKTRSNLVVCKFDRISGNYIYTVLAETETFTATTDQQIFDLKWPMQLSASNVTVTVAGLEALGSEFSYDNVKDNTKSYTRSKGRVTFTNAVKLGTTVIITYNKSPQLLNAADRINLYYNPTTGMYGKDLAQLMDGIDYGGVEVTSYDFGTGTGWDSDAWFAGTYDTFDTTFEDEVFQLDGSTSIFNLSAPLANGVLYNIYKNGVRIDDANYGTASQTNKNAVMTSITGYGETQIILDNDLVPTVANDVIIIRKVSSDGSFLPDPRSYDTKISGGDLQFTTAKGINAEEITIDGDGFVTPTTSKGPEELVPGQILDTVDIKVYHRPQEGGSVISSNSYISDGLENKFEFGVQPQNKEALFVRINEIFQSPSTFTVDYKNKKVIFNSSPSANQAINILSASGNGEKIIEMDEFTGDGCTVAFTTRVHYEKGLTYYATVNGEVVDSVLISTEDSTIEDAKAQIVFGQAPANNAVINFAVYTSKTRSFSKIEKQVFTGDGSTVAYTLTETPYNSKPASHNVIIKIGNKILNPGYNEQFDVTTATREYFLRTWQVPIGSFDNSDVLVLLNGVELAVAVDYNIVPANSSVELSPGVGKTGDILEIYIRTDGEYAFGFTDGTTWTDTPGVLYFTTAPALNDEIEVITFSKHDVQAFERINYDAVQRTALTVGSDDYIEYNQIRAGLIKLRYTAPDAQFVWLTINGQLQTPSVDYKLTDDRKFIKYFGSIIDNDVIETIQFSSTGENKIKFGFRQFKDVLNRTHYKRLGDKYVYKLAKDLSMFDKEILIDDATTIPAPDKSSKIPGIVFINGERIEYLIKTGNILKQITRGTLGTGVASVHESGSDVFDQGIQQTAPYSDYVTKDVFTGDASTSAYQLSFIPKSVNEFEVFVGGKRLRKTAISVYNASINLDSPEADVTSPAEFSVDGTTNALTLANTPGSGVSIQVIRRQGKVWTNIGVTNGVGYSNQSIEKADSLVSQFFKAEKVSLPK